ncbi:branched-chain amino acid ABC transporter substrate-binding protein [Phycicoccus sp. HDW14]|uniref:branched-chain amino acid ABC transporter substrate-binding protein n=1 Tax=Phycicoccus sp. HDW14 TaxID=2714941 RepID=UPI00140CAC71|nr:branched-chain amino acid ABC transporter substrate-binding protein [Phycicoccus sp. HDW14]QIM20950.1 branched-chain amino acid ABC transporter substrate-binding protein [Phycicoccus sp. HDW14]
MPQRSVVAVGASLLVASLALTGCGTRGGDDSSDTGGGSGDKVAKIGVIAPLSGDLAALGKGIEHSVDLAIKQANEKNAIPGWKLELAAEDDQATPDVGKNAATKLASDKDVVGVVGTLNSSVAQSVQPVLAAANITMVSPANTNPSLTQGADFATAPKRAYPNYFRTCTTDSIQGPFAARYLFEKAGIKEVATVHDKKTYGQGLVDAFTKEFTKLGGKIVSAQTINPDDDKYDAVISKIKPSNPKAVYYGGEFPQAGPFSQQMKAAGLNVPLMGGDGIFSGEYVKLAGSSATGDLATSVGAPTDQLESAKAFVTAYEAAKYSEPYEAYGAYAYDAANSIIEALKTSLKDASSAEAARTGTVTAMSSVSFDGVTGKVAFDEYGDTTSRVLTVYQVKDGKWAPVNTEEFK